MYCRYIDTPLGCCSCYCLSKLRAFPIFIIEASAARSEKKKIKPSQNKSECVQNRTEQKRKELDSTLLPQKTDHFFCQRSFFSCINCERKQLVFFVFFQALLLGIISFEIFMYCAPALLHDVVRAAIAEDWIWLWPWWKWKWRWRWSWGKWWKNSWTLRFPPAVTLRLLRLPCVGNCENNLDEFSSSIALLI